MAGSETPSPSDIAARASAGGNSPGPINRIVQPCRGTIDLEAAFADHWRTSITNAPIYIEDSERVVCEGAYLTEGLNAHDLTDGDAPVEPIVTLGTFAEEEVAYGPVWAGLMPDPSGDAEADAGMDELGAALTTFRDQSIENLSEWVTAWEERGIMSIYDAKKRGVMNGLNAWWKGETEFWGGVSTFAIQQAERAQNWYNEYYENKSPMEQAMLDSPLAVGVLYADYTKWFYGTIADGVSSFFSDNEGLADYIDTIMTALRDLASGTVDVMQKAIEALMDLPGDLAAGLKHAWETGQEWKERMVLIASETNAFEAVFHVLGAVLMNMTPNFWAEMIGVIEGFILPEIVITVVLAVIAALSGGTLAAGLVTKVGGMVAKWANMAKIASGPVAKCLNVIVSIVEAFRTGITALGKIGRGLHKSMSDLVETAANGTARIVRPLNQYKVEIDPTTLGINGGSIRIVRKADPRWTAKDVAGRRVYQRDDLFDPDYVDPETGLTNRQLMQDGQAPIGHDGRPVNLHHMTQDEPGVMAEVGGRMHSENDRILHMYSNQYDKTWVGPDGVRRPYSSAPPSMNRGPFNRWKREYWKERANDF
ncbi:HNH/ENDO VII family nuclease [Pseudaestuariivita rosea]|uniref:HNH/ENDO VII family nuclease n=1 Tax=Pseudaestuariivita rosea TaxID=2763263 RepID=UPI001ABA7520|nr:HNH/ENDO VII family nuclease [Pseudaestuariivita rosea]